MKIVELNAYDKLERIIEEKGAENLKYIELTKDEYWDVVNASMRHRGAANLIIDYEGLDNVVAYITKFNTVEIRVEGCDLCTVAVDVRYMQKEEDMPPTSYIPTS